MKDHAKILYAYIGEKVRIYRKSAKLKQWELADEIGLGRPSIANLKCGNQEVPLSKLYEIAAVCQCDIACLLPTSKRLVQLLCDDVKTIKFDPPKETYSWEEVFHR